MKAPSEKHLEDWIVDNLHLLGETWDGNRTTPDFFSEDASWISETEFVYPYFERILKRQARFPSGIADLITSNERTICAVELKQGAVDGEAISQVQRYMHMLRRIYEEAFYIALAKSPEVNQYFDYSETVSPDNGMHVVRGMVIGHSVKDAKWLTISEHLGIEIVTYDYEPETNLYRFTTQSSIMVGMDVLEARNDFARGIIGQELVNIVLRRTNEIKMTGGQR